LVSAVDFLQEHTWLIHRPLYKMKSQTRFFIAIGLLILILGSALLVLLSFSTRGQAAIQVFPATINRDCAPWDGTAFTMSFRYDPITTITVSIWQSPSFIFPVNFSFPDESMRVGTAYSLAELDPLEELTGKVTFWRVEEGMPVEGEFNLTSARGERFEGKFVAEWENKAVYCG